MATRFSAPFAIFLLAIVLGASARADGWNTRPPDTTWVGTNVSCNYTATCPSGTPPQPTFLILWLRTPASAWINVGGVAGFPGSKITMGASYTLNALGNWTWEVTGSTSPNNTSPSGPILVGPFTTVVQTPTTFALSATNFTYNGSAQGPYVVATPNGATISTGGTLLATDVGSYTATATGTGVYGGSNSSLTWSIGQAGQSINFPNPGTQNYGTPLTLSATASSGLGVSYTVTGPATLYGNTVTFTSSGSVTITAYQAGNNNYTAAPSVSQTFTVNPLVQSINFPNPGTQTYGTPLTLNATASSGLGVSYNVSGPATLSGNTLAFTGTGSVTVTAAQAGNSIYAPATNVDQTFTVNPQPATFALNVTSFPYDGSAKGPTVIMTPGGIFTPGGTLSAVNVGTYTATAAATGNHTGSNSNLVWYIASVTQTITFNNPGDQLVGVPVTLNATASSGLPVTYAVGNGPATVAGNTVTFTGTGSVTITASQAGNTNYSAAPSVNQTFAVTRPPPITVTPAQLQLKVQQPNQ